MSESDHWAIFARCMVSKGLMRADSGGSNGKQPRAEGSAAAFVRPSQSLSARSASVRGRSGLLRAFITRPTLVISLFLTNQ